MEGGRTKRLRGTLLALAAAASLAFAAPALGQARLLPPGFFDTVPRMGPGVAVTADRLTYNADTHEVFAEGDVEVDYQGYHITGEHLVFDQRAGTAHFVGDVNVEAPDGTIYTAPDMRLSQAMHDALMEQLTITTKGGGLITAGNGHFRSGDRTVLTEATYAPCGVCIDAKGHRIGWSVKSARMVYDHKTSMVTLDRPTLYLLGIPVAWLPWLSLPDPSKRVSRLLMPSYDSSPQIGSKITVPYFIPIGEDTDIILSPTLLTRQGFLIAGEWDQRFPKGAVRVRVSGIQQRDPGAFTGQVGDRQWRGAIQAAGAFTPVKTWTVGWSYTAFTDAAFFSDYRMNSDKSAVNEVYATHLAGNEFLDFRIQRFNLLGNVTAAQQDAQALTLPNARYRNVLYLPDEMGEIDLSADLQGISRAADDQRAALPGPAGPVPYDFGRREQKVHGTVEADWQRRWIVPGGFVLTPFLGLRADAAYADYYPAPVPGGPGPEQKISLFNATPIAALDVRFPMIARTGPATHLVEPIAQLVYRGSDTTDLGITNDNAQSFIFDDTDLFSYNRFSGTDRQETGLRANLGAHYLVTFDNGSWFDLLGGQSFQLAGPNAFAQPDPTQVTTGQGLSGSASYIVLGAQGSPVPGLTGAGKLQIDPGGRGITRAGLGGSYGIAGYNFNADYLYVAKNPERGVVNDQQEVLAGVSAPVPFVDYWRVNAYGAWDLSAKSWLAAGGGVHYDDGYLRYGADIAATGPTNTTPNDLRITASLSLLGLDGPGG
jgi:LPS-assembly protein